MMTFDIATSAKFVNSAETQVRAVINDILVSGIPVGVIGNKDWDAVQRMVDAGGQIDPADPVLAYPNAVAAKSALVAWLEGFMESISGSVPASEKLSWDKKEAAARAIDAATATAEQQQMIDDERSLTGETKTELVAAIIAKADTYVRVAALMAGLRRKTEALIDAEPDPANYEGIIAAAQVKAATLVQPFMRD